MTRSLPEWIGKTPDTPAPPRVQARIILKYEGRCPICRRKLQPGKIAMDHITALINGGENRESNLQPICVSPCHAEKTGADVAEKSKVARVRNKHLGIRPSSYRPLPGTKASGVRKRMNGNVERWEG